MLEDHQEGRNFTIAIDDGIAVLTWTGAASSAAIEEAMQQLMDLDGYRKGMPILVVDPGTDFNPSSTQLQSYSSVIARHKGEFGRLGMLVTRLMHYGLARTLSAHCEAAGINLRVFTSREEAITWLVG
jgi:hypothetical protein